MTTAPSSLTVQPSGRSELRDAPGWDLRPNFAGGSNAGKIFGLGRALLRRSGLILFTILVLNVAAYYGIHRLTPRYTASADVIVSAREEQVVDLKAVLSGLSGTSDVIESEIQVLRSREIARSVVKKLNLDQLPEFNPALREAGLKQRIGEAFGDVAGWAGGLIAGWSERYGLPHLPSALSPEATHPTAIAGDPEAEPVDPLSVPVDRFLSQLDVTSKGRSRVITVSFTSTDATLAAKVPNAVADAYIVNQLQAKARATAQATKWLDERVSEMREQLLAADEAVESYRRKAGIVPMRDSTLLSQQIAELGQELIRAREQVAAAASRVQAMARINPNAFGLNRDLDAAKARAASLEANLEELRKQGDVGSQSEIGLRALQREADADRNLYEKLLARARETSVQSGLQQPDAAIISRAERPTDPSFPKPAVMQPLFFVASCIVALLLVLWLESLDRGFSSIEQLESTIGISAIGSIPLLRRLRGKVETQVLDGPRTRFSETIRNLHTTLMLSGDDGAPKTVLFASSLSREGKSSVALALARMLASCGKRVLLIDYDLRKAAPRREGEEQQGLIGCLTGEAEIRTALRRDPLSPAYILPAGGDGSAAPDLLGSAQMHALLAQLSKSFDLILLDGAPVLEGSDTRHLARLVDATVFVVRWRSTRCATTAMALRQLVVAGARIKGTLLTMVEPKHFRRSSPIGLYRRQLSIGG